MKFFIVFLILGVSGVFAKAAIEHGQNYRKRDVANPPIPRCPPPMIDESLSDKANETAHAWKSYCHCMKKAFQAEVDKEDDRTDAQRMKSARKQCNDPYEIVTKEYGHSYTVTPERDETNFEKNSVISLTYNRQYKKDANDGTQYITYSAKVDNDHPINLEASVTLEGAPIYNTKEPLSSCAKYDDGNWASVITQTWNLAFTESGQCPQKAETFHISQELSSLTITFPHKLECGNYTIQVDAQDFLGEYIGRVTFCLPVQDDGTCKKPKVQSEQDE